MQRWGRYLFTPVLPLGRDGKLLTGSREHIELSRKVAAEGMVLLKNENKLLPLRSGTRIALFGKATFDYVKGGGGSGDVTCAYVKNIYDGLSEQAGIDLYQPVCDFYRDYVKAEYKNLAAAAGPMGTAPGLIREPEVPEELLKGAAAYADTAIISISRYSGEGWDRTVPKVDQSEDRQEYSQQVRMGFVKIVGELFEKGDFYLSSAEAAMVNAVAERFSRVIVVMNVGGMVDTKWFAEDPRIGAVLMSWQGGMEGGVATAEVLTGRVSPSGKLADTFARDLADYPSSYNFHESEDYVDYTDDIYVGYRYFETIPGAKEKVVYPFGFGLSYTTFALENARADEADGRITVCVDVINTGKCSGKEVVEVYFGAPQGKLGKPSRQLIGYQKTDLMKPGEKRHIRISFSVDDMASYDDLGKVVRSAYVMEKGDYVIYVGTDVRSAAPLCFCHTEPADRTVRQLSPKMVPSQLKERMTADGTLEPLPLGTPHDRDEDGLIHQPYEEMMGIVPSTRGRERVKRVWGGYTYSGTTLQDVAEGKATLEEMVDQLSDEDLISLLGGQANTGVANTFGFGNLPEYGVPDFMTADGPAGLRVFPGRGVLATAFPCACLLACTWDPAAVEKIGAAAALELKENNIAIWLAPALNIHRSPLCGRNFEYYSEDPYLTGIQAGAMVRGIQSQRIGATIKHFALNNKETNRKNCDSRASERAIREIYLKPFEMIVRHDHPWCIMSSYNPINGYRASENTDMLTGILRDEWGFDGFVMTDWWTYGEQYKEIKAGNEVKMATGFPERTMEALEKGLITREELRTAVMRVLGVLMRLE
ncbi:MAG: glycoside hydrolase family 3 C-terminal domain-containing protein [Clostridia bacterium]|nr:glycoside hydrolase family 3 C-terminal domain-containing protein [Clostridia bacterium]